jgi:hypothetical protein
MNTPLENLMLAIAEVARHIHECEQNAEGDDLSDLLSATEALEVVATHALAVEERNPKH